jgi:hypothetical protein
MAKACLTALASYWLPTNIAPHYYSCTTREVCFFCPVTIQIIYAIAPDTASLDLISKAACTLASLAPSDNDFNIPKNPPAVTVYEQLPTITLTSKCAAQSFVGAQSDSTSFHP